MNDARRATFTKEQYGKLADWGGRFALIVFGSLVVQQFIAEQMSVFVIGTGVIVTGASYVFAYRTLKKSS